MKNLKKLTTGLLCIGMTASLLAGCSSGGAAGTAPAENKPESTQASAETAAAPTASADGKVHVVWGSFDNQQSIDNFKQGTTSVFPRMAQLFEDHLFESNHDGTYEPFVATDWEWTEDYLTLTVHIRDDIFFHSGDNLVAEDVAFTFNRELTNMEESITSTTLKRDIESVEAVDERTVVFHFLHPTASFMSDTTNYGLLNKSAWEEMGAEAFWENPDTSGPYLLTSKDFTSSIFEFERWDEWWGWNDERQSNVDVITYKAITDATSRVSAIRAREVDIIDDVPLDNLEMLKSEGINAGSYFRDRPYQLGFQCGEQSPFHDKRLREALSLAFDREAMCESIIGGGTPADWSVSPTMMGYDKDNAGFEYNVDKAKKLVEESDYNGEEVVFLISKVIHAHATEIAQAVQAWGQQIGINIKVDLLDNASVVDRRNAGDYDICIGGSPTTNGDPIMMVNLLFLDRQKMNYDNPEFKEICGKALETVDPEERNELYKQIFKVVHDDLPQLPMFNAEEGWAMTPELSGVKFYADAQFDMRWMHKD